MHQLQRYVQATDSWIVVLEGTWGDYASEQRIASGYTRIVHV